MPTPSIIVRTPPDLRELAEARADQENCDLSDVVRSALRAYLTGDDGGETRRPALLRAEAAEAKLKRVEVELAAAKQGIAIRDVAAGKRARAGVRKDKDERFAAALEAATAEDPATVARLAALTGYSAYWCRDLIRALGAAGYAEKAAPGQWVPVQGRDIREGVRAAKALAQNGTAKIAPRRRGVPEATSPAPVAAVPPGSVKFSGDTGAGPAVVPVPDRSSKRERRDA